MTHYSRLITLFIGASLQEAAAYRANFYISSLHSLLNLATGWLGLAVVFSQVEALNGWEYGSALAVLGVYLTVNALRDLFISPSLDSLAGMDGEIWRGAFDFTLLKPVDTQFLVSVRRWRPFALLDLALAGVVLVVAVDAASAGWPAGRLLLFLFMLLAGVLTLYGLLLLFTSFVFWQPGFLFSWLFNGIFQMARYPVGIYPGALRLLLTWVVPLGLITTVPGQALAGELTAVEAAGSAAFALGLVAAASLVFRAGLRRYASASS